MRVARELYDWMLARGWRSTFGRGMQDGSWIPVFAANGRDYYPIALYSYGRVEVLFQHLKRREPFDDEQTRLELLAQVNEIPNVSLGPEVITKRPSIPLDLLATDPVALQQLERTIEWVEDQATKAASAREDEAALRPHQARRGGRSSTGSWTGGYDAASANPGSGRCWRPTGP